MVKDFMVGMEEGNKNFEGILEDEVWGGGCASFNTLLMMNHNIVYWIGWIVRKCLENPILQL